MIALAPVQWVVLAVAVLVTLILTVPVLARAAATRRLVDAGDAGAPKLVSEWVEWSTNRMLMVSFFACIFGALALAFEPGGYRGLWLPAVLACLMYALRPLVRAQNRRYARLFFKGMDGEGAEQ